jgi:hypothetical protein
MKLGGEAIVDGFCSVNRITDRRFQERLNKAQRVYSASGDATGHRAPPVDNGRRSDPVHNIFASILPTDRNGVTPRRRVLCLFWAGILLLSVSLRLPGMVPYQHTYSYEAALVTSDDPALDPPVASPRIDLQDGRSSYTTACV